MFYWKEQKGSSILDSKKNGRQSEESCQKEAYMKKRYYVLDEIRGITLLSMILYHTAWDMVYLFHKDWAWYESTTGYVWQQSICWTFILLSGFCWSFGKRKVRRGITVFGAGIVITAVTLLVMPQNRVIFGVLTLLGTCMLLMIPFHRIMKRVNSTAGLFASLILFFLLRNVPGGYIGFEGWNLLAIPDEFYRNYVTAFFGFPQPAFFSTDYFPVFPWIFLFFAGYYLYGIAEKRNFFPYLITERIKAAGWIGRHSLPIYMIHQPVIYGILSISFTMF